MVRVIFLRGILFCGCLGIFSSFQLKNDPSEHPKLVVGIVVDQMRQEYLLRFYNKFGEDGFKRMMNQGFMVRNGHYNYIPTYTGPGHASVYTGTTPATHGIIANDWYSRELKRTVYCAEDTTVAAVGGSAEAGQISPKNLYSTTITDQLKLATQGKAKVIGISVKDRGSALPAGHMAEAAYWYDGTTGEFMSSTYYMDALPDWVKNFNKKKLPAQYLSQTWNTLLPIETYTESEADENDYENVFTGMENSVFPYDLKKLAKSNDGMGLLSTTPFGNTLVAEFAKEAVIAESMGADTITDFLAVSFSSTDYIGHAFGPQSKEVEDTYVRLDRDLASFFQFLDQQVGEGNYLVFLTADHAVVDVPQSLIDKKLPGGYLNGNDIESALKKEIQEKFGEGDWIEHAGDQIFLNRELMQSKNQEPEELQRWVAQRLQDFEGINETYAATDMQRNEYTRGQRKLLQMGYHFQRSGDVLYTMEPGFLKSENTKGTSHGTGYTYDTHVPILFYGWGVKAGDSVNYYDITQIAPTVAMLLNIALPSGADGNPIVELFE